MPHLPSSQPKDALAVIALSRRIASAQTSEASVRAVGHWVSSWRFGASSRLSSVAWCGAASVCGVERIANAAAVSQARGGSSQLRARPMPSPVLLCCLGLRHRLVRVARQVGSHMSCLTRRSSGPTKAGRATLAVHSASRGLPLRAAQLQRWASLKRPRPTEKVPAIEYVVNVSA